MKNKKCHTVGTVPNSGKKKITHSRNSSKIWKRKKCHTVGTVPKSGKTKNATLSEQFQNLEKTKNATLSEQFQNLETQIMPHCRNSSKIVE
jgi:ribosomal protein L37AE/L43A